MIRNVAFLAVFGLAIGPSFRLFGQNSELDSLNTVLISLESDTNRVNTLLRVAWILRAENPTESMQRSEDAKQLSQKLDFEKGEAMALSTIGVLQYRQGDLVEATKSHMQALNIRSRIGDDNGVARSYINLGNIYSDQHNNVLAMDYYLLAAEILERGADDERLAIVYLNIGGIHLANNENVEAARYCRLTRELAVKISDPLLEAQALNNFGVCYEHLNHLDSALLVYKESYSIAESQAEKNMMVDAGINVGNIYLLQKQNDEAIEWHKKSEEIALEMGYVEGLRGLYECLANDYNAKGDYKLAYQYHVLFKQFSDSIYNEENSIQMNDIVSRLATEKKEVELKRLEMELQQQNDAIVTHKITLIAGGIVLLVICGAIVFMIVANKAKNHEKYLKESHEAELNHLRGLHSRRQPPHP